MIAKDKLITVKNKYGGMVGYRVEEMGINRKFYANETKEVTFEELERLSFTPGGSTILTDYLQIDDVEAIEQLFHRKPEMEYFYSREDIKRLMETGSLDEFLDCLDFAPAGIKDIIKDMSVELPLNDMNKRQAILEKLGFDVNAAINIKNTKYDGETGEKEEKTPTKRRVAPKKEPVATGRRYKPENK